MMSTTTTEDQVKVTDGAVEELKRLLVDKNVPEDHGVRIGVKGGGCAGFSYILGFDKKGAQDEEFTFNGLKVYMDRAHSIYLFGVELDYQVGLNARGFVFNNPNADSTCGCGSSFSS